VRDRLGRGRPDLPSRVKLGLGINNSKLCGCVLIDIVDYNEYLAAFAPLWPSVCGMPACSVPALPVPARLLLHPICVFLLPPNRPAYASAVSFLPARLPAAFAPLCPQIESWFDLPGIRAAFSAVDFVGISAYVPQRRVDFEPCEMEGLMQRVSISSLGRHAGTLCWCQPVAMCQGPRPPALPAPLLACPCCCASNISFPTKNPGSPAHLADGHRVWLLQPHPARARVRHGWVGGWVGGWVAGGRWLLHCSTCVYTPF
jgi:hypothetical protein